LKKHLLSTSVIALGVAAAAPASAQNWNLDWGGFMNQHILFADVGGNLGGTGAGQFDGDGVVFHSSTEIIFSPSITLDNGLTFGVNVQLEGENARTIDETYMTISGDQLGRIVIGSENSAGYLSMVAAPEVTTMWINSNSTFGLVPLSGAGGVAGPVPTQGLFVGAQGSAYTEVGFNNDIDRISYFTPNFNGLVLGVSYARNAGMGFNFGNAVGAANNNNAAGVTVSDIFDIGLNYSQSFGSTDVSIGARYGTANSEVPGISDPSTWGIGMQIGFGDFTVGGHYAENDSGSPTGVNDQEGWSFGASYDAPGPWTFGVTMFKGEGTMNSNVTAVAGSGGNNSTYEAYKIGASRNLGPGVSFDLYAVVTEADDLGTVGTDIDATLVGTAINLSF
jgi:hypothetical protein